MEFFKIREKPLAPLIITRLNQTHAFLQNGINNPPFNNEMTSKVNNSNLNIDDLKLHFSEAFQLALDKFNKHIDFHSTFKLFEAIQCFDPFYIHISTRRHNISSYKIIPHFKNPSDDIIIEWGIYCGLNEEQNDNLDLDEYWKEKKRTLPNLAQIALIYIWLPISGVDVERSFSDYKNILDDKRHALSKESIEILNFLYFNL